MKNNFIDTIKILIYKENPQILENINFDDEAVFLEPLLFAYFNQRKGDSCSGKLLNEILQGYFVKKEPLIIQNSYNQNIEFNKELRGTAEIVTENLRLIERFFYQFRKIFQYQ